MGFTLFGFTKSDQNTTCQGTHTDGPSSSTPWNQAASKIGDPFFPKIQGENSKTKIYIPRHPNTSQEGPLVFFWQSKIPDKKGGVWMSRGMLMLQKIQASSLSHGIWYGNILYFVEGVSQLRMQQWTGGPLLCELDKSNMFRGFEQYLPFCWVIIF